MMMFGLGGFGLITMLIFWLLTILAAVALISWLFPRAVATIPSPSSQLTPTSIEDASQPVKGPETALAILKTRYAAGELSPEEFHRMKEDILAG